MFKILKKERTSKIKLSFRRSLIAIIVLCWVVPISIIFIFTAISYRNEIIVKVETLIKEEMRNFTTFTEYKINESINVSKKISYDLIFENPWKKYKEGKMTGTELYRTINSSLRSRFSGDKRFVMAVFYFADDPQKLFYTARGSEIYINGYRNEVHSEALKITNQDTTQVHVMIINNKIYIIRNFYTTTNYTKFGTLVLELDQDTLFADAVLEGEARKILLYANNTDSNLIYGADNIEDLSDSTLIEKLKSEYSVNASGITNINYKKYGGYLYQLKSSDCHLAIAMVVDHTIEYAELNSLIYFMIIILLIIVPILFIILHFLSYQITKPMGKLINASKELEKGEIGAQITGEMPNEEFSYLRESFNKMSSEVKNLFDYAYTEKLARKDAKIMALQSQINPHFLNNTLEMMNWQARMAGDVTVSKMIEALGTLLDYSMDRTNRRLIRLAEELRCADAYFYIISMRFGQRLEIEKEIDEELLQIQVPQLILQPLLENAVKHGVEKVKNGIIRLKVFKEDDTFKLMVCNTGKEMTKEDEGNIYNILNQDPSKFDKNSQKRITLGIRNVNERIKLIYGDMYGLTIKAIESGETAAVITIPLEMVIEDELDSIKKYVYREL